MTQCKFVVRGNFSAGMVLVSERLSGHLLLVSYRASAGKVWPGLSNSKCYTVHPFNEGHNLYVHHVSSSLLSLGKESPLGFE